MKNLMLKIGKPLLTGFAVTIVLTAVMLFLTMNFQIILIFGVLLFYFAGLINRNIKTPKIFVWLAIVWSFFLLFATLVLAEIPSLFYILLFWAVACVFGLGLERLKIASRILSVVYVGLVLVFCWIVLPNKLHQSLTKEIEKPLPPFQIENMKGVKVSNKDFSNKIVVIDFFGTWCKPCIEELKELSKVQQSFKDDPAIAFYVVNADIGGDTKEKFIKFIETNDYAFNYLYDTKSTLYKSLQFQTQGLPYLLVVDSHGIVRWTHLGYNKAETSFAENLLRYLEELRSIQ